MLPNWNHFISAVVQGLRFVMHNQFINFSRVHPSVCKFEGDKVKLACSNQFAIGTMLGMVSECNVVSHGWSGHPKFQYAAKFVTVVPFLQEMRRDFSAWGEIMGFKKIQGTVSSMGLRFQSLGEGRGSSYGNTLLVYRVCMLTQWFACPATAPSTPSSRPKSRFAKALTTRADAENVIPMSFTFQRAFEDNSVFLYVLPSSLHH